MELFGEAIELFERVDVNSLSGPDAGLWLDALRKVNSDPKKNIVNMDIPEICQNLFHSVEPIKSVR